MTGDLRWWALLAAVGMNAAYWGWLGRRTGGAELGRSAAAWAVLGTVGLALINPYDGLLAPRDEP